MEKVIKKIEVTEYIDLLLYEGTDKIGGCYISIKHSAKMKGMDGEIIITPSDVPKLVQALTDAAVELLSRGYYLIGKKDGAEARKQDYFSLLEKYYATEEGKKELNYADENR